MYKINKMAQRRCPTTTAMKQRTNLYEWDHLHPGGIIGRKNRREPSPKMMTELWKKEFTIKSLTLKYDTPSNFFTSQWQTTNKVSVVYLTYRLIIAIIFLITLFISIFKQDVIQEKDNKHSDDKTYSNNRAKWLIFLTNWGYLACTIQALFALYLVSSVYILQRTKKDYIPEKHLSPKLIGFYWVLFTIATDAAFAITSIYWSLIYDKNIHQVDAMNIFVHGINSLIMLTDLLAVAHPVRLLHCYWPFVFALVYVAFNVIYFMAGGTDKFGNRYIYSILDWTKPGKSALITFLALIFLIFLHLLTYFLYLARCRIYQKCCKKEEDNQKQEQYSLTITLSSNDTREEKEVADIKDINLATVEYL